MVSARKQLSNDDDDDQCKTTAIVTGANATDAIAMLLHFAVQRRFFFRSLLLQSQHTICHCQMHFVWFKSFLFPVHVHLTSSARFIRVQTEMDENIRRCSQSAFCCRCCCLVRIFRFFCLICIQNAIPCAAKRLFEICCATATTTTTTRDGRRRRRILTERKHDLQLSLTALTQLSFHSFLFYFSLRFFLLAHQLPARWHFGLSQSAEHDIKFFIQTPPRQSIDDSRRRWCERVQ